MRDKIGKEIKVFNKHVGKVIDVYNDFFLVLLNEEGKKKYIGWKYSDKPIEENLMSLNKYKLSDERFYFFFRNQDENKFSFFTVGVLKNE